MITADKVKNQIQTLIDTANGKTGNNDADLTSAVGSLVEGFGGSGADFQVIDYVTTLLGFFRNSTFPENTKITLRPKKIYGTNINISNICNGCKNLDTLNIYYDSDLSWIINGAFRQSSVKEIDLGEKIIVGTNATEAFYYAEQLEKIHTELDFTNASSLTNTFARATNLREIRITKNSLKYNVIFSMSTLLSDESIQSIIDGLSDRTGLTALVLTVPKEVKTKIESNPQQLASIVDKNWTLM